jgi:hypothetical protein
LILFLPKELLFPKTIFQKELKTIFFCEKHKFTSFSSKDPSLFLSYKEICVSTNLSNTLSDILFFKVLFNNFFF